MSNIPEDLLYTSDHEWVRTEGAEYVIGITDHAQNSLGDVTFVELPSIGESFDVQAVFGVVESVKAASDLFMPIAGEIIDINEGLNDSPESVNSHPYQSGWMIRIRPSSESDIKSLLSPNLYKQEIGD
ncbi:MAG: glycine cleavage system protein GcvH [Opitutales bacterium]|nr:glycine cleavage system protein GcvH [Opitutales bacterium]